MVDYEKRVDFLIFVPCAMGPLSILGSSLLLLIVYRTKHIAGPKSINTYHRLLSGIAIFDIILSIGLTLGPLPVPSNLGTPGAHGNTASCTFQGFVLQVGYASFAYSTSLMIYYVLMLRFRIPDAVLVKYIEPWLHAGPLLFHLTTGFLGLSWEVYNPQSAICWVGVYPPGCDTSEEVVCERGEEHVETFGLWMGVYPSLFYAGIIVLCLITVVWTVIQKSWASRQFVFQGSATNRAQQERIRLVITQSLLYGFFYLNVTFWGIAGTIVDMSGRQLDYLGQHFWLASITLTLFPLQGFFFFLIHIRPRYLLLRRRTNLGRCRAFTQSIWEPESPLASAASISRPSGEISSDNQLPTHDLLVNDIIKEPDVSSTNQKETEVTTSATTVENSVENKQHDVSLNDSTT